MPGPRFLFDRAIEGPLDATFELNDRLSAFLPKMKRANATVLACVVLFWLIFVIDLVFMVFEGYFLFEIRKIPLDLDILIYIMGKAVLVLFFAVSLAVLLFLFQIWWFDKTFSRRYSYVSRLLGNGKGVETGSGGDKEVRRNPAKAVLDLVEHVTHQLPHILRMLKTTIALIGLLCLFQVLSMLFTWQYGYLAGFDTPGYLVWLEYVHMALKAGFMLLALPTVYLLAVTHKFFLTFLQRHRVIDNVKYEMDLKVPSGKDEVERLVRHLKENDHLLREVRGLGKTKRGFDIGTAGKPYKVDGFLVGETPWFLRPFTGRASKAAVFIKVASKKVTKKEIDEYSEAVRAYVQASGTYPLRTALVLRNGAQDITEEVYQYVLEGPRFELLDERHYVQLIVEDEGAYSFIPNIGSPI